uniref:Protein strawberry notch homolog 1 n=1 Tax=Callorhinchus milii TaxID=7868 RepID=A0A4W3IVF5_CALMI
MRSFSPTPKVPPKEEEEPEEEEDEELGHADTYAEYMPMKLKVGLRHPDPVVETSSLSSVTPPDVWYRLTVQEEIIDSGWLSALQLEAITYAAQQHETFLNNGDRAAFLIGDGAGVGKGRTIAGIIFENYLLGRKRSLWFSVSNDLKYDAERDLRDIGAKNIQVHPLNKISSKQNGSVKKGVIFATYSSLIGESQSGGKYKTRLKQLLHWCGEDFDGVIVFDECHKAKNLSPVGSSKPTKTGLAVLELQNKLPKARVVYASATGASEPRNMAYMNRLGIWGEGTPFKEFNDFIQAVERRGVGAMEIVAMDMKLRGMYIARQLSFSGVTFKIEEVPLSHDYIKMYNKAVRLWVEAREKFQMAAELIDAEQRMKKSMWGQFWSAHQRFFKYLCIASKVRRIVQLAREEIKNGKCVVIGLQSTGEARTLEALEEGGGELNDFVSTCVCIFVLFLQGMFFFELANEDKREAKKARKSKGLAGSSSSESESAASESEESDEESFHSVSSGDDDFNPFRDESSDGEDGELVKKTPTSSHSVVASQDAVERAQQMKRELLDKLERLAEDLPPNTLDELIDELGGPDNVAEMTGRKGRVVSNDDGSISYESRSELDVPVEILNITEKQRFMGGEKNIAIISEAASSGISLQADRRVKNQRRRVHMTLELPWSADRAIQQFGRTHRSNQVTAPEYVFLISELAGEQRFASIVAKRLESLGALTHGDRRATETRDLSRFNFDNKYGRNALEIVMKSIVNLDTALVPPPKDYPGDFFKGKTVLSVFRLDVEKLGVCVISDYNNIGKFLNRILGMEVHQQNALFQYFSDTLSAVIQNAKKNGRYDMGILGNVERGMSWDDAVKIWAEQMGSEDGFYLSLQVGERGRVGWVVGAWVEKETCWAVVTISIGLVCEVGLRCRSYHVLCGSVLSVWTKVEGVLASVSGSNVKMQIVRLKTEDGQRIVGECARNFGLFFFSPMKGFLQIFGTWGMAAPGPVGNSTNVTRLSCIVAFLKKKKKKKICLRPYWKCTPWFIFSGSIGYLTTLAHTEPVPIPCSLVTGVLQTGM